MSKKEWLFLWFLFIAYLFMGATIFYYIERDLEEHRRRENQEKLLVHKAKSMQTLSQHISQYCTKEVSRALDEANFSLKEGSAEPYLWTYYNAFFFTLTTLSTIGYGNIYPSSNEGKMILIVYALIGIPFTGIILARLGDVFESRLLRAHHRYKNHVYESRLTLVLDVLIYLVPGIVIFIFAPTIIFMKFEDWTFYQAFYYAFITLTTIGFGDLVAGQSAGTDTVGETLYKIFILVWIMFGLGYLVMILGFITRALKSKKLANLEQKLTSRFKATQSKIWNEFVEDVSIMRRALNEAYINKVKPVYREKQPLYITSGLSRSMPDLPEWPEPIARAELEAWKAWERRNKEKVKRASIHGNSPPHQPGNNQGPGENNNTRPSPWQQAQASGDRRLMRRRAMSEGVEGLELGLPRVMSEGALVDIDIETTFKDKPRPSLAHQDLETDEFLNRMVTQRRLSVFDPSLHDGGYDLFSDDEILQSEHLSSRGSFDSFRHHPKRSRARSDAFFNQAPRSTRLYDHQITWSGSDSLQAQTIMKNLRDKEDVESGGAEKLGKPTPGANFRRLSVAALNFFSGDKKRKEDKKRKSDSSTERNQNARRTTIEGEDDLPFSPEFLNYSGGRRPSLLDVLGPLASSGGSTPLSPMLEQTSLADFIRIMSTLRGLENRDQDSEMDPEERSRRASIGGLVLAGHPPSLREPQPAGAGAGSRHLSAASSANNLGQRARRYSQAPTAHLHQSSAGFRRRAISISQGGLSDRRRASGRFTPPARVGPPSAAPPAPPSLVVTSPDGTHRFRVDRVRGGSLTDL